MRSHRITRWLSYIFFLGGVFLLFLGAREFFESRLGQSQAARAFDESPLPPSAEIPASETDYPAERSTPSPAPARHVHKGDAIAKLIIPRLDAQLYVVEGAGHRELRRGPGHMPGSALPGDDGNCIIAGHRDTHFRVLKDVRKGDAILLQTPTGEYLYRVSEISVVSPDNTAALKDTPDPELNLITCYPFYWVGSAPKRYIVQARLAGVLPALHSHS
jgi:sortase A